MRRLDLVDNRSLSLSPLAASSSIVSEALARVLSDDDARYDEQEMKVGRRGVAASVVTIAMAMAMEISRWQMAKNGMANGQCSRCSNNQYGIRFKMAGT
jgi:hypothetical protein